MPPAPPGSSHAAARLALRPGVHVLRRDDHHLQVGLDHPQALVLRDDPAARRLLEDLRTGLGGAPRSADERLLLARLRERGLLVDAAEQDACTGAAADRAAALAAFADFGPDAPRRLRARAASVVAVEAPPDLAATAARTLRAHGVLTVGTDHDGPPPSAALLVTETVLARDRLDEWLRAGLPHLVVAPGPAGLTLGPFVVPGTTACLRCVDARLSEQDPRRPVLLEQCGPATVTAGPTPRDPALQLAATALAVRDLVSFLDGDRPATWSATVALDPGLTLTRHVWPRHPYCGCAWDELTG